MKKKNRNARFGRYPSCDLCNNALRFILKGDADGAFKEIVRAIQEADGYFHDDIADIVQRSFNEQLKKQTRSYFFENEIGQKEDEIGVAKAAPFKIMKDKETKPLSDEELEEVFKELRTS